jgi:cytoskeletal protein CcmA (bactofilin family)
MRLATWLGRSNTRGRSERSEVFASITPNTSLQRVSVTSISSADVVNSCLAGKCTLSSGVKVKGSITFQKELVMDGTVQGKINSHGVLTIGENADIRGEIKVKSVTVYGKVHGNITAERCELKSKSTLEGDLRAASLIIEEGATFMGSSQNTLVNPVEDPEIARDRKPSHSSQASGESLTPEGSLFPL